MGWAKDMLFAGGYLSPAVLAEEIELELAVRAAEAARQGIGTGGKTAGTPAGATRPLRVADASARPCA